MKKKYLSLLLCATMAGTLLAGCGNEESKKEETTKSGSGETNKETQAPTMDKDAAEDAIKNLIANTDGKVTLNVWCSEMEAYQTTVKNLVDQFTQEYSDVDFDIKVGAVSESDARSRVLEDVEAAADVFVFADDQIADLVSAGALQEVAATYTYNPGETNSEATVKAASVDGKLYAYPLTASNGYFLYYNSEYLTEEDCASWDTLLAKAKEKGKKVGMEIANGWYLYGFFGGAGCELTKNDDGSNTCTWNDDNGVKTADAIKEIAKNDAFVSVGNDDAMAMLPDGDLIAYVSGTWNVNTFQDVYKDGYAACKLPTFNMGGTQTQMSSYAGYKFVGVNSYSKFTGWSMLLAEFLTSESSQKAIADATGEGPANIKAAETITSPALEALVAQSEFAHQQIVGDKFWDPAAALGASLVEGKGDSKKLLDEAVAGITQK